VATGAVAIPLKLPAPDFGTVEQAGPKSMAAVDGDDAAGAADEEALWAGVAAVDEVEPHAAAPRLTARPATATATVRGRYFMSVLLDGFGYC
jgi:hypothetical protein